MVQYVFTPWRDRQELLVVRGQFYGSQREERHRAVARVSMWMQRGRCPHMVESTALLMAAVLSDGEGSLTYAVRAAYSAAFSRFVTGLLDGHQEKLRKQSMYSLAKAIGLPATFVELRHQATHEQLPSLARLRDAADKALRWIWGYYWEQLGEQRQHQSHPRHRELVMAYLTEEDEEAGKGIARRLARVRDREGVLATVKEVQRTLPGNKVFLKCVRLSRELVAAGEPEEEEAETGGEEDVEVTGWSPYKGAWRPKPIGVV